MSEINVNDYFTEIIDEGRSTIGYSIIDYKINELVHKIYEQNKKIRKIKSIAEKNTKKSDYLVGQDFTELVDEILNIIEE